MSSYHTLHFYCFSRRIRQASSGLSHCPLAFAWRRSGCFDSWTQIHVFQWGMTTSEILHPPDYITRTSATWLICIMYAEYFVQLARQWWRCHYAIYLIPCNKWRILGEVIFELIFPHVKLPMLNMPTCLKLQPLKTLIKPELNVCVKTLLEWGTHLGSVCFHDTCSDHQRKSQEIAGVHFMNVASGFNACCILNKC